MLSALAGITCLTLTTTGHAAQPFVSAGADVVGLSGIHNNEALNVHAPSVTRTNSISDSSARGSTTIATSTASADASGTVNLFAQASAATVAPDFPAVSAHAFGVAEVGDTVSFMPGTYSLALSWDGSTNANCTFLSSCVFSITDRLLSLSGATTLLANDFQYDSGSLTQNVLPPSHQIAQRNITFASAVTLDLAEQMILTVQAEGERPSSFTADFSHTGHLFIDPVSVGASYTTASGNLFLTPAPVAAVPEAETTWLLTAGLSSLALFAIRRRRLCAGIKGETFSY